MKLSSFTKDKAISCALNYAGRWNAKTNKYDYVPFSSAPSTDRHSLTVATWNVMIDKMSGKPYKPNIAHNSERHAAVSEELQALDADVITLNEVTRIWFDFLTEQEWVKDNYYVIADLYAAGSFGNLVLSKELPVSAATLRTAMRRRPPLMVDLGFVCVIATHLSARSNRVPDREKELKEIYELAHQQANRNVLILGDLNFHSETENVLIADDYTDLWPDGPFTFDAHLNLMIDHLWPLGFEHRRMRLDRVLLKSDCIHCTDISLFGNTPVYPAGEVAQQAKANLTPKKGTLLHNPVDVFSRTVQFFCDDVWGIDFATRRPPKEEYLMPSDHFGIVMTLTNEPELSPTDVNLEYQDAGETTTDP
eukprot:TRINITY_DN94435_c0_g1_i1.p1 TRINITY_DN94435_c0_g1~~TRINITY_DN94435_c0_g1_i1.p1  ORF type:complete len:364 (+),score=40.05 TRINITY_DN94435_c0_g1_i1:34-1125(+)